MGTIPIRQYVVGLGWRGGLTKRFAFAIVRVWEWCLTETDHISRGMSADILWRRHNKASFRHPQSQTLATRSSHKAHRLPNRFNNKESSTISITAR